MFQNYPLRRVFKGVFILKIAVFGALNSQIGLGKRK